MVQRELLVLLWLIFPFQIKVQCLLLVILRKLILIDGFEFSTKPDSVAIISFMKSVGMVSEEGT